MSSWLPAAIDPTRSCWASQSRPSGSPGLICSSESLFEIAIEGRGGHASMPQLGRDAIIIGKQGLARLFEFSYVYFMVDHPVADPHMMIMGVGDAWCDRAPLQVTQFEPDIRIAEQLTDRALALHSAGPLG